nr:variable surface lipoprotein [Mycoplasmopsis bovis]
MKKSKFLLLGSVASLASIPFVARLNVVKPKKKINQSPTKIQVEIKTLEENKNPGEKHEKTQNTEQKSRWR